MEYADIKISSDIQDIYEDHWGSIRTHHYDGPLQAMYNIRWPTDQSSLDWEEQLMPIFDKKKKKTKNQALQDQPQSFFRAVSSGK